MFSKKKVYVFMFLLMTVVSSLLLIQTDRKCTQCGLPIYIQDVETEEITIYRESLLARMFSLSCSFLHYSCVDNYLREHPIERDEEGHIIPKT